RPDPRPGQEARAGGRQEGQVLRRPGADRRGGVMLARVSNLEAFRQYRESEDMTAACLVRWITASQPTPAMLAGTAFHAAIEVCGEGEFDTLEANGHTFLMPDAEIALPEIRELRGYK